jgi:hypothetical protein
MIRVILGSAHVLWFLMLEYMLISMSIMVGIIEFMSTDIMGRFNSISTGLEGTIAGVPSDMRSIAIESASPMNLPMYINPAIAAPKAALTMYVNSLMGLLTLRYIAMGIDIIAGIQYVSLTNLTL